MNWPIKFGFKGHLKECIGKTIEAVEVLSMEYGSSCKSAWFIKFTDGERAYIVDGPASHIFPSPCDRDLEKSSILTAQEWGEICANKKAEKMKWEKEQIANKRSQLERLKKELGEK